MKLPSLKLLLLIPLLLICFSVLKPKPALAIQFPDQSTYEQTLKTSKAESLETFSSRAFLYYIHNLNLAISGGQLTEESNSGASNPGAIHIASNYISQMIIQPPASSVEYLAHFREQLNLATPVYAQVSSGYQGLSGVMAIWQVFRNIAYAFFVIIFVIVGFMIMFRTKLNPQTVINLQLALPKLIITLILITFSYAIAGLILDIIYLLIYLSIGLASTFNLPGTSFLTNPNKLFSSSIIEIFLSFKPWEAAEAFSVSLSNLFPAGSAADIVTELATLEILGISLIKIIISVIILFSVFKLLFQLILAYINIIVQVIFSPIMILLNALPQTNTFSSWLKNLLANAAAFPTVTILVIVGNALIYTQSGNADFFVPPFIGFISNQNFLQSVIGIGIILFMPQAVKLIQEALKTQTLPVGQAVAAGIGAVASPISAGLRARRQAVLQRQQARYQAQQLGKEITEGQSGG